MNRWFGAPVCPLLYARYTGYVPAAQTPLAGTAMWNATFSYIQAGFVFTISHSAASAV